MALSFCGRAPGSHRGGEWCSAGPASRSRPSASQQHSLTRTRPRTVGPIRDERFESFVTASVAEAHPRKLPRENADESSPANNGIGTTKEKMFAARRSLLPAPRTIAGKQRAGVGVCAVPERPAVKVTHDYVSTISTTGTQAPKWLLDFKRKFLAKPFRIGCSSVKSAAQSIIFVQIAQL